MKKSLTLAILGLVLVPVMVFAATEDVPATQTENKNEVQVQTQVNTRAVNFGDDVKLKIQEMNDAKTAIKEKLKEEILEKVKTQAEKAVANSIKKYEKTKTRVQAMTNITAENKALIQSRIESQIALMEQLKARIAVATTVDEVKGVLTQTRTQMRLSYNAVKDVVSEIHTSRLTEISQKITVIYDKLVVRVTELKTDGVDVTKMEILEAEAKTQIDAARAAILAEDFVEAKTQILDARTTLVELVQLIKTAE